MMAVTRKVLALACLLMGLSPDWVSAQSPSAPNLSTATTLAPRGGDPTALKKSALDAMQSARWYSALPLWERLLALTPNDAFAQAMYGQSLQALNRSEDALHAFVKATELDPKLVGAWVNLCWTQIVLNQPQAAQMSCERAVAIEPNNYAALANLGHSFLLQGIPQIAQPWYQRSLRSVGNKGELEGFLIDFDFFIGKDWQVASSRDAKAWFQKEGAEWLAWLEVPNKVLSEASAARSAKKYTEAILLTEKYIAVLLDRVGPDHRHVKGARIAINQMREQLGDQLMTQYNFILALSHYQKVLAFWEQEGGFKSLQVARSLVKVAGSMFSIGHYADALPLSVRALSIFEQVGGPEHPETSIGLMTLANLYSALDRDTEALPLSLRALAIIEQGNGPNHLNTAFALVKLAAVQRSMGRHTDALPLAQRALAIYEKESGPEHSDTANALAILADLHLNLARHADALLLRLRVLAISEKIYGPDHSRTGAALRRLAECLRVRGRYAEALSLSVRSIAISEKANGPDHSETGYSLDELAEVYRSMGRYEDALPLMVRSLAISEKVNGTDHSSFGKGLSSVALLYESLGRYSEALPLMYRALGIAEKIYGVDDANTASVLHNLAYLYESMGRYGEAVPLVIRAVAISEKGNGLNHPRTSVHLHLLAELYRSMGRYTEAEPLYLRALEISEKGNGLSHPDTGSFLNNLAELYRAMGHYADALPLYVRALAISESANGPDHPYTGTKLSNLALLHVSMGNAHLSEALYQRAWRIASVAGRPEAAWTAQNRMRSFYAQSHPQLAILYGKQAVNTLQQVRVVNASLDKETQRSFLDKNDSSYKALADLLFTHGRLLEGQQVLAMLKEAEYFDFVQRTSAADPRQTLAGYTDHERPWNERYAAVSSQLAGLGKEREALLKKAKDAANSGESGSLSAEDQLRKEKLDADLAIARQAFDAFMVDLKLEFTQGASAQRQQEFGEKNLASLRAMQGTLRDLGKLGSSGTVLVHYLITDKRLWILLTTQNIQLKREAVISSAELNRQIGQYRQAIASRDPNIKGLGKALYEMLIAPIAEDLKQENAQTLMLSLDGSLRYLPMAALYDGEQYLAQRYRLSLYTAAAKDKLKDRPQVSWTLEGFGVTQKIEHFEALPSVKGELNGILQDMKGSVRLDKDFTAKAFKTGLEGEPSVVHLASHFVFKPGNETDSFLLMGDGKRLSLQEIKDGYEFVNLDLLTLSACETAVGGGADANGREVEGFGALAQNQGAKGVIATLWPVADQSTGQFMQLFYGFRQQNAGMTKAHAMQMAQRAFIDGRIEGALAQVSRGAKPVSEGSAIAAVGADTNHPYFWAPFILMGNWL